MDKTILFFVAGTPIAQGSKTLMRNRMIDSNPKLQPWRNAVALEARRFGQNKITGPVRLSVSFMFERPKSHLTKSGLAKHAPLQPIYKPDLDKLTRAVGDALSVNCHLLQDDSQITEINATKRYCLGSEEPGALIQIDVL
jgi:Holliday junction resolvase RusA-like endonuclease